LSRGGRCPDHVARQRKQHTGRERRCGAWVGACAAGSRSGGAKQRGVRGGFEERRREAEGRARRIRRAAAQNRGGREAARRAAARCNREP
jgi:hypothetical protein